MPIQIKELIVKTTINEGKGNKGLNHAIEQFDQSDLITACVEQVLEILKRQKER